VNQKETKDFEASSIRAGTCDRVLRRDCVVLCLESIPSRRGRGKHRKNKARRSERSEYNNVLDPDTGRENLTTTLAKNCKKVRCVFTPNVASGCLASSTKILCLA